MKAVALSLILGLCAFAQSVPMHKAPAPPADAPEPGVPPSLLERMPDAPSYSMPTLDVRSLPAITDKGGPALGKHRPLPAGRSVRELGARPKRVKLCGVCAS
jgi:hypothetical protein